jgi:trans-aconitate 2-methyltransferase
MNENRLKWNAELYQKSSALQFQLGLMAIERLNPRNEDMILEIGCGNALITIELAKLIPDGKIIAVEMSEEMTEQAKLNLLKQNVTNVEIININALDIDFIGKFDIVFSNSAMHWITNLEAMYGLIFKALKRNGRIMIQTGLKNMNLMVKTVYSILQNNKYTHYLKDFKSPWKFLTIEDTNNMLEHIGFIDIQIDPYEHRMVFNSEDELLNYFATSTLVPFLNILPDTEKELFKEDFLQNYLKLSQSKELDLITQRLFISAKK